MRKRTGIRNKYRRTGVGSYSRKGKGNHADRYGKWDRGERKSSEVIDGKSMSYTLGEV